MWQPPSSLPQQLRPERGRSVAPRKKLDPLTTPCGLLEPSMDRFLTVASTTVYIRSLAQQTQSFVLKQVLSPNCVIFVSSFCPITSYLKVTSRLRAYLTMQVMGMLPVMINNLKISQQTNSIARNYIIGSLPYILGSTLHLN